MPLKPIEQSFSVAYAYKLHFTQNLFDAKNPLLKDVLDGYKKDKRIKLLFVIDDGVSTCHPNLLDEIKTYCSVHSQNIEHTESILIKGGEQCKNDYGSVERVLKGINNQHIDRHSFVIGIGGGALIDMVGYAAAIAHRGVKLIRIPTTRKKISSPPTPCFNTSTKAFASTRPRCSSKWCRCRRRRWLPGH